MSHYFCPIKHVVEEGGKLQEEKGAVEVRDYRLEPSAAVAVEYAVLPWWWSVADACCAHPDAV